MKKFINKVCNHSKRITVKLKRHHKKFLFWALCCWLLALIGILSFSKSKADNILDYLDSTWTATWMTIVLNPWRNVFSTPALLSNISFSNGWNGITLSKLENGQWISVMPNTNTIKPLEWFLVKNSTNSNVKMFLTYKDTTPSEDMLQKKVSRWRNLLWITTIDDPFYNIHPGLHLDFTKNAILNLLNSINTNYISKNWTIEYPEIWEAYWIFLSSDGIYWWSNNRYWINSWSNILLYNDSDYSEIIWVTPWSYNIPLLKWRVITDRDLSFRNSGFYIQIDWANAYEDIAWYEAGWIIYDIIVNVWSCTSHINKSLYTTQTDSVWHKRIFIPLFETCNTIPEWSHEISVLLWINSEYATNFKTGMTISMDSLNSYYLNNVPVSWKIRSSVIEVSHDNLPSISITQPNDDIVVNITTEWTQSFSLWSIYIRANEPWESVSVLFDVDRSSDYVMWNLVYVDMYINWNLSNTTLYNTRKIKYLIPLSENTGTKVLFVWRFNSWALPSIPKPWSFVPKIIVNSILKNDITHITQNCPYYKWWCTQFNWGVYTFNWSLINVDWWSDNIEWCPIEDVYACLMSEDYDSCVYSCSSSSNIHQYPTEIVEWYAYAYDKWLTTMNSINNANLYGNLTKIALAKIMVQYATNVLWLIPNESISCELPSDVTAALNSLYDNAYTKLCQLRMTLETWDFQPFAIWTYADFWTWLSRALNANNPELLNELNNESPYYSWHLNWLKREWIFSQNNPTQSAIRWYVFVTLMGADEGYTPNETCSIEELMACVLVDNTDACLAACTGE